MQTQELYQLALFLQVKFDHHSISIFNERKILKFFFDQKEAMMREEMLNKKLRTLQTFIDQAKENSENGWLVRNALFYRYYCKKK